LLDKDLLHVSIARSLYLSLRFGGVILILRGTRLRLDRGARIRVPRGCQVMIGKGHAGGAPASPDMRRNARLTFNGSRHRCDRPRRHDRRWGNGGRG
jgi:hypothetical protein